MRGAPCLLRAVYLQQEKILCGSHFRSIVACVLQGFSSIQIVDVSKMFHNFIVFSTLKRLIDYYETIVVIFRSRKTKSFSVLVKRNLCGCETRTLAVDMELLEKHGHGKTGR